MNDMKPSAVVVGSGLNALGILRCLANAKINTHLVAADDDSATRSRFGRKYHVAETAGDALLSALEVIGKASGQKPVLFLTEEKSVLTVSEYRDRILPFFRITLPAHELLVKLMRKEGFQELAQSLGSPIPQAVHLKSEDDLIRLTQLRFPCVVKPAVKDYSYGAKFQKAYVAGSADEAASLFRKIAPVLPDLIAQEWIEGSDSDIYFCFVYIARNSKLVASFVGRKLRSWPPRIGGTASCVAAPQYHEQLTATTELFFRQVGFAGMGSMEFKRDTRDGCFYMVEPTVGRTDFQEEVAALNGVNIPLAAYCNETRIPLPECNYSSVPRVWREPTIERWAAEALPEHSPPVYRDVVDSYWRFDDPGPWLDLFWRRIAGRAGLIRNQLMRRK